MELLLLYMKPRRLANDNLQSPFMNAGLHPFLQSVTINEVLSGRQYLLMKRGKWIRHIVLAAGAAVWTLFLSMTSDAASYYTSLEHTDVTVNALERADLDLKGTAAVIDRFYGELTAGMDMDREQIVSDYRQIVASFDLISDKMLALQAQYYLMPRDEGLKQQINSYRAFLLDQENYVRSLLNVVLQYKEYDFLTKELSDGEKAFIRKTTQLPVEEEDGASQSAAETAKVNVLRDGIMDLVAQYYIQTGAEERQPEQLAGIYLRLVGARSALAHISGYEDYYAYQAANGNDIMPETVAEEVHQAVKETITPLYREVRGAIDALQLSDLNGSAPTEMDQQWEALRPVIRSIHPDLMEAYDNLTANRLYLRSPATLSGYTAPLYTSNSAFIFTSPKPFLEEDYINMTHEFGHFNNDYHTSDHHMYAETHLSVRELHSQGLELLSWHHSGELFGPEENEAYRLFLLGKKLVGILDGSVIDEMERKAFEKPDMSAEELKAIYEELHRQYFGEDAEDPWFFTTISHIYETPFYYMHYATSALNALELWNEAFDSEPLAVERYMRATAVNVWTPYQEMVSLSGLRNMQDADSIRELADRVGKRLASDRERRNEVLQPIYEAREQKAREEEEARILALKEAEWDRRKRIFLTACGLFTLALLPALAVRAYYRRRLRPAGSQKPAADAETCSFIMADQAENAGLEEETEAVEEHCEKNREDS